MFIFKFIFIFLLFSFIGYLWEVFLYLIRTRKFVNRGNLIGPWLNVYGAGGVFLYFILSKYDGNIFVFFLLSLMGCGIIEYFFSYIEEVIWNKRWWDYSDSFLNFNGRVCFVSLLFFGVCGVLVCKFYWIFDLLYFDGFCFKFLISLIFIFYLFDLFHAFFKPNVGDYISIDC